MEARKSASTATDHQETIPFEASPVVEALQALDTNMVHDISDDENENASAGLQRSLATAFSAAASGPRIPNTFFQLDD